MQTLLDDLLDEKVSTHSRPKAAGILRVSRAGESLVSTHSRPKAAGECDDLVNQVNKVSTHSRPKAAGAPIHRLRFAAFCFNTQPPEGGWSVSRSDVDVLIQFQHTAARRRLDTMIEKGKAGYEVSTHSRPKAAGRPRSRRRCTQRSFNTQPPEGGWMDTVKSLAPELMFQHTAARRRLVRTKSWFY